MRKYIVLVLLSFSCSSVKKSDCDENLEFKDLFFYHVNYIEDNIWEVQDFKFRQSVIFIYNYAPVSTEHILNYATIYPNEIFEKDKVKWIEWYEENKCKNLQFKASYIIPEVYGG